MSQGIRFSPASISGQLWAHWVQDGKPQDSEWTLDRLMEVDHVIRVDADGLVWDNVSGVWAPEARMVTDEGQFTREGIEEYCELIKSQGWEPEVGYPVDALWGGDPVMHSSQFIGGNLAEHIVSTPGLWTVIEVRTDDDGDSSDSAGWVLLYREVES